MRSLFDPPTDLDESQEDKGLPKEEQVDVERQRLLQSISSYDASTILNKIAMLLNRYPDTRDSDIDLQIRYWIAFEREKVGQKAISLDDYRQLTPLTTIARARAKIQNEYHLFLGSPETQQHRHKLADERSQAELAIKPVDTPLFDIYIDESGKQQPYLLVGSMWMLSEYKSFSMAAQINSLKERFNIREFHFKDMKERDLLAYKKLVDIFMQNTGVVSFKFISCPHTGISDVSKALDDLTYHLISRGVEQEYQTSRTPLPFRVNIYKDAEEIGRDSLFVANMQDRFKTVARTHFNNQLTVNKIEAVESSLTWQIQVVDLLIGSINRILNNTRSEKLNHKDELAAYFTNQLGITDVDTIRTENIGDMVVHIRL